ncbi:MAG: biotin/lipoyl-containing protein, partial [Gammaproteobacteria bacterium]
MKTFNLPDLGEGLPEAEIVTWHVKEGDEITLDQPMLSVETAKAVVEVPSPLTGRVARLYAGEGDIVETGKPLIDIDTGSGGSAAAAAPGRNDESPAVSSSADSGTVVGSMP